MLFSTCVSLWGHILRRLLRERPHLDLLWDLSVGQPLFLSANLCPPPQLSSCVLSALITLTCHFRVPLVRNVHWTSLVLSLSSVPSLPLMGSLCHSVSSGPFLFLVWFTSLKDVIYTAYFSMFWLHFSRGFPLLRVLWLLCLLLRLQAPPDNCHLSYILCTCGVQLTYFQLFFPFPFLFFFFVFVTTFTNASSHSLFPCYSSKIPLPSSWPPWMFVGSLRNLCPASVWAFTTSFLILWGPNLGQV